MALKKIKFEDQGQEKEIEVEEIELEKVGFDQNVCTPREQKCVGHVKLQCRNNGSGWFNVGTC